MPYILNSDEDIQGMLRVIGVGSLQELYAHLPLEVKLSQPLDLAPGLSEEETRKVIKMLAQKNRPLSEFNSFLGAGCYDHYVPSALDFISNRSEFLTGYTPYQAECSQGILQAIYEYQSYICILTGMEVSNASLLDGASSLAEATLMALRLKPEEKTILVSKSIHPEYRQTLKTYLSGFNYEIIELDFDREGRLNIDILKQYINSGVNCLAIQSPNFFGVIEDLERLVSLCKEKGILSILVTNPISLAILKSPGSLGIDIVCGEGSPLGGKPNWGGPGFGFLASRRENLRQMPGRIVGRTVDKEGKSAYCLTLQAREQHIRREKATSNICSNHSLNAILAAVYLALMGKDGFTRVSLYSLNLAHYLKEELEKIKGVRIKFGAPFFNEFVWEVKDAPGLMNRLYRKKIIAGLYLGNFYPALANCVLSTCTEKKTKQEIDAFIRVIKGYVQ